MKKVGLFCNAVVKITINEVLLRVFLLVEKSMYVCNVIAFIVLKSHISAINRKVLLERESLCCKLKTNKSEKLDLCYLFALKCHFE